ncbi:MAG: hypothetical protein ABF876_09945 [Acetobacter aceti]|uniref:Uncharacterized protein n=1 Tax=Acetobacter aceti TaxID=435 RepID=A0A1U9KJL8_ACEAC|nr:hypothetical protein [Acetobacter aceti]AQS85919.1 hypothetical protein A0U92_15385 [Acetobacter aceti]
MYIDMSGAISAAELSIQDGSWKPEVAVSSAANASVSSVDRTGAATLIDLSSESSDAIYQTDPVVLLPQGDKYIPVSAGVIINGIPASQVKGAVTFKDGFQLSMTSSSSSFSLYTEAGAVAGSSQTSASFSLGADTTNNEESLIAKLFSSPTKSNSNIHSEQLPA